MAKVPRKARKPTRIRTILWLSLGEVVVKLISNPDSFWWLLKDYLNSTQTDGDLFRFANKWATHQVEVSTEGVGLNETQKVLKETLKHVVHGLASQESLHVGWRPTKPMQYQVLLEKSLFLTTFPLLGLTEARPGSAFRLPDLHGQSHQWHGLSPWQVTHSG